MVAKQILFCLQTFLKSENNKFGKLFFSSGSYTFNLFLSESTTYMDVGSAGNCLEQFLRKTPWVLYG